MRKSELYEEWQKKLARAKKGFATVSRNVTIHDRGGHLALRYYDVDIVQAYPDGSFRLYSGGYRTPGTSRWISTALPPGYRVFSDRSAWWISKGWRDPKPKLFQEGTRIGPGGAISTPRGPSLKRLHVLKKRVDEYCAEFADRMLKGKIPKPGPGDCLYCYEAQGHGKALGDIGGRAAETHLLSHLKERYFVPPLLLWALKERCTYWGEETEIPMLLRWPLAKYWSRQEGIEEAYPNDRWVQEEYEMALKRYFYRRLGISGNPKRVSWRRKR